MCRTCIRLITASAIFLFSCAPTDPSNSHKRASRYPTENMIIPLNDDWSVVVGDPTRQACLAVITPLQEFLDGNPAVRVEIRKKDESMGTWWVIKPGPGSDPDEFTVGKGPWVNFRWIYNPDCSAHFSEGRANEELSEAISRILGTHGQSLTEPTWLKIWAAIAAKLSGDPHPPGTYPDETGRVLPYERATGRGRFVDTIGSGDVAALAMKGQSYLVLNNGDGFLYFYKVPPDTTKDPKLVKKYNTGVQGLGKFRMRVERLACHDTECTVIVAEEGGLGLITFTANHTASSTAFVKMGEQFGLSPETLAVTGAGGLPSASGTKESNKTTVVIAVQEQTNTPEVPETYHFFDAENFKKMFKEKSDYREFNPQLAWGTATPNEGHVSSSATFLATPSGDRLVVATINPRMSKREYCRLLVSEPIEPTVRNPGGNGKKVKLHPTEGGIGNRDGDLEFWPHPMRVTALGFPDNTHRLFVEAVLPRTKEHWTSLYSYSLTEQPNGWMWSGERESEAYPTPASLVRLSSRTYWVLSEAAIDLTDRKGFVAETALWSHYKDTN